MGPDQFCLVLLRRMGDYQPDLVADAIRELEFTRARMREVNAQWQRMVRSRAIGGPGRAYRAALGEPHGRARRAIGDLTAEAQWWELPLWPELRFEILTGPDGRVWQEWLVRADPSTTPPAETVADLRPWRFVIADVAAAFPTLRHTEGSAPGRWASVITENGVEHRVDFTWGLLQNVTRLD
ncbi:hypothetical protein [Embleya hyalina]|uniref:Uncharacterized protein n=1 Tax=Embleya hyalina TaxID=516124 RepID=A0A401YU23_9ACTN|nr:hypothetical protein [Embleya hyalina]GCD98097.1 hypothetical protein EHYA_05797 [Embleya hyalina]